MLILFDIDATLISTSGIGIGAMLNAGRDLFGPDFTGDGVPFAGRLDPLIIRDLLLANGRAHTADHIAAMKLGYARHLARALETPGIGRALPGVLDLLAHLRAQPRFHLGLLTGNFEATGAHKLRACGVEPDWFPIRVWGDESPHEPPARAHLPPVAMSRHAARTGSAIDPSRVVIIGDTPHDVECARANGCRCLGVATGSFSVEALRNAGADMALPNLADLAAVRAFLG
ncbi:MAG: HAD family hydrolase [Phycisphaerales bacterium]